MTRLKELRKQMGLRLNDVANELGISKPFLCNLEKGRRIPSIETLLNLATFYKVSTDYILGLTEEKKENTMLTVYHDMLIERDETIEKLNVDNKLLKETIIRLAILVNK